MHDGKTLLLTMTYCEREYTFAHDYLFEHAAYCHMPSLQQAPLTQGACGRAAVHADPPCPSIAKARAEAEMVMFESVRQVLATCGVSARQARQTESAWNSRASAGARH